MCQTDICYSWSPTVLLIKQKQIVCEGRLENGVFNGRLKIEEKREMNNAVLFHPAHVTISSVAETIRQLIACCQRLRVGRTDCARLCARRCFVRASHAACTREVQGNLGFWIQDCQCPPEEPPNAQHLTRFHSNAFHGRTSQKIIVKND